MADIVGVDVDKFIDDYGVYSDKSMDNDEINMHRSLDADFLKTAGARKFSYGDLVRATNNFSEKQQLGNGGFGSVYKGFLKELNRCVAVKRVLRDSNQGIKEYASEVKIISQLRHRNIVQLMGWCHKRKELLLVYEFMPNDSLDSHLFKENRMLAWEARYNIAQGLACGLLYLHEEWEQYVVHRDIKASNVLLDSNFNAKLGDFGLARLAHHGNGLENTPLAGTVGYVAPEYATTGRASKESDVYSFGIVALEIASGRKATDRKEIREDQMNLTEWVWDLYGEGKLLEAIDPRLDGEFDRQEAECLGIVGLWCAHPDAKLRPTIKKAIHVLSFVAPMPNLPSKMPMFSYFGSFSTSSSGTIFAGIKSKSPSVGQIDWVQKKQETQTKRGFTVLYKGLLRELNLGIWRSKGKKKANDLENMVSAIRMFSYQELVRATNNFSDHMEVGYEVYKGFLPELKSYVAVERVTIDNYHYVSQVKVITPLRHKNIVQLVGFCHVENKLFLVYKFMPIGSLDYHLFNKDKILKWKVRYRIAQDLASGLLHMHEEWEQCALHKDITSSIILLDSNFNAKLWNFCYARLMDHGKSDVTTSVAIGRVAYAAPENHYGLKFSRASDVYKLGIVALEIACGRKPLELQAGEEEEGGSFVEWVRDLYERGKLIEAVDPRLHGKFDEQQAIRLIFVGLWCTHPQPMLRPSIRQAIQVLNFEAPPLLLPPEPKHFASLFFRSMSGALEEIQNQFSGNISETILLIGQ